MIRGPGLKQWHAFSSSATRMLTTSSSCPLDTKEVRKELEEMRNYSEAIVITQITANCLFFNPLAFLNPFPKKDFTK